MSKFDAINDSLDIPIVETISTLSATILETWIRPNEAMTYAVEPFIRTLPIFFNLILTRLKTIFNLSIPK